MNIYETKAVATLASEFRLSEVRVTAILTDAKLHPVLTPKKYLSAAIKKAMTPEETLRFFNCAHGKIHHF